MAINCQSIKQLAALLDVTHLFIKGHFGSRKFGLHNVAVCKLQSKN